MKLQSIVLLSSGLFVGAASASGQSVFNAGTLLTPGPVPETFFFEWFGKKATFYTIELSENLVVWNPILIERGYDEIIQWGFATNADRLFARLRFVDFEDNDNDGLPDWWEMHWFGDLTSYAGIDDSPGDENVSVLQAYLEGRDPHGTTSVGSAADAHVGLVVFLPF